MGTQADRIWRMRVAPLSVWYGAICMHLMHQGPSSLSRIICSLRHSMTALCNATTRARGCRQLYVERDPHPHWCVALVSSTPCPVAKPGCIQRDLVCMSGTHIIHTVRGIENGSTTQVRKRHDTAGLDLLLYTHDTCFRDIRLKPLFHLYSCPTHFGTRSLRCSEENKARR